MRASLAATIARHRIDFVPGSVELGDFDPAATAIAIGLLDQLHLLPEKETNTTFDKYLAGFRQRAGTKLTGTIIPPTRSASSARWCALAGGKTHWS